MSVHDRKPGDTGSTILLEGPNDCRYLPFTRVPAEHLLNMVRRKLPQWETALEELDRRGGKRPPVVVTGHATDRVSLKFQRTHYRKTRANADEGLYSWLCRKAAEALKDGARLDHERYRYEGLLFVFDLGGPIPVLKTVMADKLRSRKKQGSGKSRPDGVEEAV